MSEMKVIAKPLVNDLSCMMNLARHYLMCLDYAKPDTIIATETLGLLLRAFVGNQERIQAEKVGIKEAPNPFANPSGLHQVR